MFASPSPTQFDLHFRIAGVPIRIHPFFWIIALLLTIGATKEPVGVLVGIAAILVSVIVHEMGHALLQRRFGGRPAVVLYGLGGLAFGNGEDESPRSQILISLAGPGAGFLLAAILFGVVAATGHEPRLYFPLVSFVGFGNEVLDLLVSFLFFVNIVWGVINLLPVYPLDGGHVAREVLTLFMPPGRGIVASLWLSIVVAAFVAALFLLWQMLIATVLFGLLAYNNYQALEAYRRSRGIGY